MLTLISFIVLLLVLIFVHELGHFIAAKLLGVKVERFSLGFPPKVWSKTIGETEYQLAWLPLGGYVKMYGEDPNSEEGVPPEMESRSFSHKPAWAKIIIVLAGPVSNLIFAALLFWGLIWVVGIQHLAPVVGPVTPGSPAAGSLSQVLPGLLCQPKSAPGLATWYSQSPFCLST
jgi:regulator of sigma E protease